MTDDEYKELLREELESKIISKTINLFEDESIRRIIIDGINGVSIVNPYKGILLQSKELKSTYSKLTDDYLDLIIDIICENKINSDDDKLNFYISRAVDIFIKYEIIIDTMLSNIDGYACFLSRKADVMPSVDRHFNGKKKKNYIDGREKKKAAAIEYAKNKWKSNHEMKIGTLANEIKLELKMTHTTKAIENWIREYKPQNSK